MKLQGRNLVFGMQGNDVSELQRYLVWLDFDILSEEITNGYFGETTRDAVQMFQKQNGLEVTGVVELRTVSVINRMLGNLNRMVRGNLRQADGKPIPQATIRAFDKNLRTETKLGEVSSNNEGYFEIGYTMAVTGKDAPNLVVKGFRNMEDTDPVAVSEVIFEANPEIIIDLVAGETEFRGLPGFELLMKDINPVLEGQNLKIVDLVENEKIKDVSFLSNQTRHTSDQIVNAVLAQRYAEKSRLEPEVFYAFLSQGLPIEPSELLSQDSGILRRALVQAVNDNVIPQVFKTEDKLQSVLGKLKEWRASVALENPPDPKKMTLGSLVKRVLREEPQQQFFMRAYAEHSGSVSDFWKKLEQDEQLGAHAAELKFAVTLGYIGQNHFPLVDAIRSTPEMKNLKDLADLNEDKWYAFIIEHRVGTPVSIEGMDDEDRTRKYARALANAIEAAIPTEFFVARLKEADIAGKEDLLKFFQANPSFDIKNTQLDAYLKVNPDALNELGDKTAATKQLKSLKRLYNLTQSFKPTIALQQVGKESSHSISRMGKSAFVTSYGQHFDNPNQAKEVYAKAQQVSAAALVLLSDVNPAMDRISMHAVPDTVARESVDVPQLSTLFGSLDFCSCKQCQSVYSPAAYMVDLLNFLNDRKVMQPEQPTEPQLELPSVKDILFARRPDLGEIELSCENTNTVMPYVDLVLELLENAVAPPSDFSSFELDSSRIPELDQGRVSPDLKAAFGGNLSNNASIRVKLPGEWWIVDDLSFSYSVRIQENGKPKVETRSRQTYGIQKELAANPQYVNSQAYEVLKQAIFPWDLPFDKSLEEVRAYLEHLGVPRHLIIETFLPGELDVIFDSSVLVVEYLGLSRQDAELISGTDPSELWVQWGFESGTGTDDALVKIKVVDEFLRRSRLEYRDLLNLLQLRYINSGKNLKIVSTDPDHPATCETDKLELHGLNADSASRIVRFVRLWRKLGWTMFNLDRAITSLGLDLNTGFLMKLSHLLRLHKRFDSPVDRLFSFWAPLDTVRYKNYEDADKSVNPSLYDQLFRNLASTNPLYPAFTEEPTALTGKLADHIEAISAALTVSVTDLYALIQSDKVFPQAGEKALNIGNLSSLYRHVTLTKALKLQIQDYLRALEIIDYVPFTDTINTLLFVESVNKITDSGFSFAELDYLLRHHSEASSKISLEERVIIERLQDIRQQLQKGAVKEVIARKLAELFGFEMRTMDLLKDEWGSLMDPILADASKDLTKANFPQQFEDLVRLHEISMIAANFHVGTEMLEWLLDHGDAQGLFDLSTLPATPAIPDLQKWTRLVDMLALRSMFSKGEKGLLELLEFVYQTPFPTQDELLDKLVEITNWSKSDLEFLVGANGFSLDLPRDFNEKTLMKLRDCFALLKLLGISAEQAKKLSAADVTPEMARTVRQAVRAKYDDTQWSTIAKPLRDVLREGQRVALVSYLVTHLKIPHIQLEIPHPDLELNSNRPAVCELQRKLNAAGADPAVTVDGVFDSETHDAVVAFQNKNGLLADGMVRASTWALLDFIRRNLVDVKELYAHLLIDAEMDPCMMTSRIKQAISSVQLFVQRCLMNLEPDVLASSEKDDAWNWWRWMKNYRIWEANRKVFLYPENWIEPELRDDKSPFFKELESELMESDLTLENAETAFLSYVEKLDQVARLEVMGVYHQKDNELDILHVFARTQAPPHVYYYRQRVNSAYWTHWEKIDLDIEGNHLMSILWNGRLFLFWPIFIEKTTSLKVKLPPLGNGGELENQTKKYWEMKLAWSERKQHKWTGKKVSSGSAKIEVNINELPDLSKVFFTPLIYANGFDIGQQFVTTESDYKKRIALKPIGTTGIPINDTLWPPVFDTGGELQPSIKHCISGSQNLFSFGGCYFDPQILPHGLSSIGSGQNVLIGTERFYMSFQETENKTALNLPIRRDLDNSQAALAKTLGKYRVVSQGADPRITRNPFFFQDHTRSYLVIPKLSWWDDIVIDPSEIGGIMTERQMSVFSSPAMTHDLAHVGVASASDLHSSLAPGFVNGMRRVLPPDVALGPDTHRISPFIKRPNTKYRFHTFYHPYMCSLISILNLNGLDQMLRREVQLEPQQFLHGSASITSFSFEAVYGPSTDLVAQPYPTEEIDFGFSGSYSLYNWELFFHAPLLIADRLSKNQRFGEAAKWFHYIFNPTDATSEPDPQRYWQTKEFFEKTKGNYQQDRLSSLFNLLARASELRQKTNPTPEEQKDLQRLNDLEASIKAWREQPFKPHLVARMRTTAYQKSVVMKYIDNLIAWGDQLFRMDTLETINEATQLYILAADILGTRPVEILPRLTPRVQTYNSLETRLDDYSNALVEIEEFIPVGSDPGTNLSEQQPPSMPFFCLPKNDKLLSYWDSVADRLFKIRHCMNIEGVVRQLPLFEPPIEPGLLVRGAAAGLDLSSLLNDTNPLLPGYRFNVMAQKATELCSELKSLGATLLAALEKRDAEELSLLRAKHETGLLELIEQVREKQLEEASTSYVALQKSRELVVSRYLHYQSLLGVENPQAPAVNQVVPEISASPLAKISESNGIKQISYETTEMSLLEQAASARSKATAASLVATHFAPIPDPSAQPMGVGAVLVLTRLPTELAQMFGSVAEDNTYRAGLASRNAQYVMRAHEWTLQNNIAAREIMQIDKQLLAAEIRREIARNELQNHRRQMANTREVEEFMHDKYTNQELFSWMVGQMSGVYFQAYQLAYETAKRAELCYRNELGGDSNFIQFGYWDSLRKGLMAGEKLHLDIKRMEMTYYDLNKREYELTKHISLLQIDPLALLQLRSTGRCTVNIPEEIFDMDGPGHYFRRIKNAAVSIPCVIGPYASINCKLTLRKSSVRNTHELLDHIYPRKSTADNRFKDYFGNLQCNIASSSQDDCLQSIVTSSSQNDSGLFETNLRDERYLPFEGSGVISEWQLELPADPSKNEPRQFDYDTISDVILHIRYTAREGGTTLRQEAIKNLNAAIEAAKELGSTRLFSVRYEFPTEWAKFQNQELADNQRFELVLNLRPEHYPFWSKGNLKSVKGIDILAQSSETELNIFDKADNQGSLKKNSVFGNLLVGKFASQESEITLLDEPVGELSISFEGIENRTIKDLIKDLWIAVTWSSE